MKRKRQVKLKIRKLLLIVTVIAISKLHAQTVVDEACGGELIVDSGNTFQLFQSSGNACMTVLQNRNSRSLTGEWSRIGNALIRESRRQGSLTNIDVGYNYNISRMQGNVYHGAYGWWNNAPNGLDGTVEWYVVLGYNNIENPRFGMDFRGEFSIGRTRYLVYTEDIRGAGSVYATRDNFTQVKIIRASSVSNRSGSGRIDMNRMFTEMQNIAGLSQGNLFELSYVFEGFGNSGTSSADFALDVSFPRQRSGKESNDKAALDVALNSNTLSIYPNPATDSFNIKLNGIDKADVSISDMLGKIVYQTSVTTGTLQLQKNSSLKSGIYLVKAVDGSNNVLTSKLIIN